MRKEEVIIDATKAIVVAAVTDRKIPLSDLPALIELVSQAISKAYDNCQQQPGIG